MATTDRYLRYLWINGIPYMTRDESAQTEILKVKATCETIKDELDKHDTTLGTILDNTRTNYKGKIPWNVDGNYKAQVEGSKIPYFKVISDDTHVISSMENLYRLVIELRQDKKNNMIYLFNNNGILETFYNNQSEHFKFLKDVKGLSAMELTDEEYNACDCTAYIKNGLIVLGKNPIVELKKEIQTYRTYLEETDYIDNKIIEGDATREDYADVITKRKEYRKLINDLEEDLDKLE